MSEASELENDVAALEDDALQKRFAALFDDGQGENARQAFVNYCRSRNYHPTEMYILYGNNMFRRLRDMLKRQEILMNEYRAANKYLFSEATRLNGGKTIVPPTETAQRATQFQRLIRAKFGDSTAARKALKLNGRQFSRLLTGADITDGLIERLEERPDYVSPLSPVIRRKNPKKITNQLYEEFERKFSYISKPKKGGEMSNMTSDELRQSVASWPLGDDWIEGFARFSSYSPWHIQKLMKGGDNRTITKETERFIRQVNQALQDSGGFTSRVT